MALANKEAEALAGDKTSFVWDTTASNPSKIKMFLDKGYDVYMVMVYTHPVIAFISNTKRKRRVPSSAVFSTWNNVYQLIENYNKMLKGNLSIFINDRGGDFDQYIKEFDTAAKNGADGISDYLQKLTDKLGLETGSTFRDPIQLSKQVEQEFFKAVRNIDYNTEDYSEDRALKKYFSDWYNKKGVGPGEEKMEKKLASHRREKENAATRNKNTLDSIADDLYDPLFQEKLVHSTPAEIDSKIQNFLS